MISKLVVVGMLMAALLPGAVFSQDISLELVMPGTLFGSGSPFYLDLSVVNIGTALPGSQLFVALSIGSDFWFYPQWVKYPPDLDWMELNIAGYSIDTMRIIPEFFWPSGTGEFSGAMFLSAVVHNGALVSNLADITFGWSDAPQSTPTPIPPTPPSTHTPTPAPTSPPTPSPTSTQVFVAVGNMILVPAGTFTQGSPSTEPCRSSHETQFSHILTRSLSVMETEVTRLIWADLMAVQGTLPSDPSYTPFSPTMSHPVQQNTWYEAVLFANLLSIQNGYTRCYYANAEFTLPIDATNYTTDPFYCNFDADGYRLPSEGEWEYFTRAGTTTAFSCDEENYTSENCRSCTPGTHTKLEQYCVFCANASGSSAKVGSKQPNPFGLMDVHGNVAEWCWDRYGTYPTGTVSDYVYTAEPGAARVFRGGIWFDDAKYCRSADRRELLPDERWSLLGFRLVRTVN